MTVLSIQIPVKAKLMFLLQDQNLYGVDIEYRFFHYYFLGSAIFLVLPWFQNLINLILFLGF